MKKYNKKKLSNGILLLLHLYWMMPLVMLPDITFYYIYSFIQYYKTI